MILFKCLLTLVVMFNVFEAQLEILSEKCVVCSYVALNAPCIVNTSTGDIWDAQVFPPHPNISNAIYEKEEGKDYGYCWLQNGLDYKGSGIALPDTGEAWLGIDVEGLSTYNSFWSSIFLCQDCLDKLSKLEMTNNFAVVDVYGLADGRVEFYALKPDSDFWLRHYHVFVDNNEHGGLDITIESIYYDGGKELDY